MNEKPVLINWEIFAQRVKVGTSVQHQESDGSVHQGTLLENYPHAQEERYASYSRPVFTEPTDLERDLCWLRYQEFGTPAIGQILPYSNFTRYLIDGQWRTFDEVMA